MELFERFKNINCVFDYKKFYKKKEIDKLFSYMHSLINSGENLEDIYYQLGRLYELEGLPDKEDLAREWYTKAASTGNSDAMHRLGVMQENFDEQEKWYLKAIDLGNKDAMGAMGILCEMRMEYQEAKEWYIKAEHEGLLTELIQKYPFVKN